MSDLMKPLENVHPESINNNRIKKITMEYLEKLDADYEDIAWYNTLNTENFKEIMATVIASDDRNILRYGNWLIARVMNHKQRIKYTIFAARQVLHIFEEKYPCDKRPRKAIEAAEAWLENPCEEIRKNAKSSALSAENAAWHAAWVNTNPNDRSIPLAAAWAVSSARAVIDAKASFFSAKDAASLNDCSASSISSARAIDRAAMRKKILEYGMSLLEASK